MSAMVSGETWVVPARQGREAEYHAITVARDAICEDSVAQLLEALDDIPARRPLMEKLA